MSERLITKDTYDRLSQDLERMKTEERMEIAERIRQAKEFGDLSENAEYKEALDAQATLEQRILDMDVILREAKIIKPSRSKTKIEVGVSFEVRDMGTKNKLTFTLVGFGDANPMQGKISTDSPLGAAFLEKTVDDEVEVKLPERVLTYKVLKIL